MDMFNENVVLCVSNSYEKKYYFNPDFDKLPASAWIVEISIKLPIRKSITNKIM